MRHTISRWVRRAIGTITQPKWMPRGPEALTTPEDMRDVRFVYTWNPRFRMAGKIFGLAAMFLGLGALIA